MHERDDRDALAWETVDSTVDYRCPGFAVRRDEVVLPDGTETEFHYLSEPASVVVLPLTPEGRVVVIEEWRQAVGRVNRGFPAGGLEPGDDDLPAAARRELTEETGYEAETVEPLLSTEPLNGAADSVHTYFLARGCRPTGDQDLDADESIRVETTTVEELAEALAGGDLRDGRTALGLSYYRAFHAGDSTDPGDDADGDPTGDETVGTDSTGGDPDGDR